jgi:ABC-type multidrug transport system ATPase subunit
VAVQPAIAVADLHVKRGDAQVLRGVSLEVAAGAVTGLLGPSGCGKSTLMRAIVGVQIVASGTITVLGRPAGSPALRTQVGYVTQAPSVYGDLSVRENLQFFGRVLGTAPARVDTVIATVGLGDFSERVVNRLSGGQRARVSLATALLNEPPLLVLDEPTGATCGRCSGIWPRRARACSSRATSWTRPATATGSCSCATAASSRRSRRRSCDGRRARATWARRSCA